ncbi:MAG UNVERIFIED_CONTAM: sugar phosphate isomerase/epimerase [Planctomycetaceae bacterium]|jgi:2-keto-myo-inositol isomerase
MHRRTLLTAIPAATVATVASPFTLAGSTSGLTPAPVRAADAVRYCLNTSTLRGQKLGIVREVTIAAQAGYQGLEPWIPNLREFVQQGGSLDDLRKQISDAGLTVDSAIGFAQWIHPDDTARSKALEEARRDMDMLRQIGGTRIAAPPVGAHQGDSPLVELSAAAERFAALQKIGRDAGVQPQLEVWGFSKNLSRLGEVAYVAAETGDPTTLLLLDTYHIHKGGSDFAGLSLFSDQSLQVFHMNDYPAEPPRAQINDSHRVYPGDGIAPLNQIIQTLAGNGRSITLSLELFNPEYWKQDAAVVAATGLAKMRSAVERAFA